MTFIIWILTFLLVVNCGVLILLVLLQLPKKDSGAGFAFGGGAADALFGAGSGNAITKITKWAIAFFVIVTVILGALQVRLHSSNTSQFEQSVEGQQRMQTTPQVQPPMQQPAQPSTAPTAPSSGATPFVPTTPANNAPAPAAPTPAPGK